MSDTITIHRPLTEQEFNEGCGFTFRGIDLREDEYGTFVYAYGRINKNKYAAAVNDYDLELAGFSVPYASADVQWVWAVILAPADSGDGWFITWGEKARDVIAEHGGDPANAPVFPVTVVAR